MAVARDWDTGGVAWVFKCQPLPTEVVMSKGKNRIVSKTPDGEWANKVAGASRASSKHSTQADAAAAAKAMLLNQGGGELIIKGLNGKIRSKDTIGRPDPLPPRDKEH